MPQFDENAYINNILQGYQSGAQQPAAQLQETRAAAGAAGASAANAMSEIAARQQALSQHAFFTATQQAFDKAKTKNGKVPPEVYNAAQQQAASLDIGTGQFDSAFKGYVDPTNINYNTESGLANQNAYATIKRQLQSQIDNYNSIPEDQKGVYGKTNIPNLNPISGLTSNPKTYLQSKLQGTDTYLKTNAPQASEYEKSVQGLSAQLKDLVGAGQGSNVKVSQAELNRWASLLPSATKTDAQNKKDLQILDSSIKATFNVSSGLDPAYVPSKRASSGANNVVADSQGKEPKAQLLNGILQMGGALGGGALGAAGGAFGGAMIPGADLTGVPEVAGGYAGGVAGAGVGSGAGNAAADFIRKNLLGDKTINDSETLPNSVEAAKQGAIAEAIGVPAAKGLGFLAHPIAPFIKQVDSILAKSSKQINVGDVGGLLQQFKDEELPRFHQMGLGKQADDAYAALSTQVTNMVSALRKQVPGDAGQTADVNSLTVPISTANTIKRNLTQTVKDLYGEMGNTQQEMTKGFARITKNAIAQAEPGVKTPNAVASALYKLPDTTQALAQILSVGNPAAAKGVNTVLGLPAGLIQRAIPEGGGYLNQALPRLLQSVLGLSGGQQ